MRKTEVLFPERCVVLLFLPGSWLLHVKTRPSEETERAVPVRVTAEGEMQTCRKEQQGQRCEISPRAGRVGQ